MASEAPDRVYHDHNVYILGAGFSRDAAGLPTVDEFMRAMAETPEWLANQDGRQGEIDAIRDVLNFRRKAASAAYRVNLRLENIEELFSLASISEGGALTDQVVIAISATIDYAQSKASPSTFQVRCESGPWRAPGDWKLISPSPRSYEITGSLLYTALMMGGAGLNQRTPERRDTIITFNYDLVIENALRALRLTYTYGIDEGAAQFESESCRPDPAPADAARILKLHGSINWARPKEEGGKALVVDSYDRARELRRTPVLVPPTWQKSFGDFLLPVWNAAIAELTTATRVVIAGYSVPETDLHFKYLLAAGLQKNISLRSVLFVNREADALKGRLTKILRQDLVDWKVVEYRNTTLEQFFGDSELRSKINRDLSPGAGCSLGVRRMNVSSLPKLQPRSA
jgi:hypothetical protein